MTIVSGTSGNDTIYGGTNSSKTLMGYGGDDTYVLYNSKSKVVEMAGGGSNDTIQLDSTYSANYASYNYAYTKYYNWDSFGIKGYSYTLNSGDIEVLDGSQMTSNIRLISNLKTATTIKGGSGNDYIVGGKASDIITGGNGDDILYGGVDSVSDILQGGSGCDVYVIRDGNDVINDTNDNLYGNRLVLDKAFSGNGIDLNSQYMYAKTGIRDLNAFYVKKSLTLRGSSDEYTYIEGGSGNDTIYGGSEGDILLGGKGNDFVYGDDGFDTIEGDLGNDTLDGGNDSESDILAGGFGNDTYIFHGTADTINEDDAKAGNDTIKLSNDSVLSTLNLSSYFGVENIDGSDITSTALTLTGSSLVNKITGGRAADVLSGGNDLTADTLTGGDGNDTYLVYSSKDKVVEYANTISDPNTGSDTVALQSTYNLKAYTMANNVEILNAMSISKAMTLTGNASSNTIKGTSYADKISGNAGADILYGYIGNDTIDGGVGNDTIYGGTGNDKLTGGVGDDTFVFAAGDGRDVITATDKGDIINIQATNVSTSDMLFYTDKKGALYIDYTDDSITGTKLGVGADVISIAKGKWDSLTTVQVGNKEVLIGSIIQAINASGSGLSNLDATAISALTTVNQSAITLTWNAT